jgi:exopolysaccharide biosynthesis polyprenyl glycosylphosphotransferase
MAVQFVQQAQVESLRPRDAQRLPLSLRVGADLATIVVSFWLAHLLRYQERIGGPVGGDDLRPFTSFLPIVVLLASILLTIFAWRGVYRLPRWTGFLDEARLIIGSTIVSFSALSVIVFYGRHFFFSRLVLLYALIFSAVLLTSTRLAWRQFRGRMRARRRWVDRVLVVGSGPAGERVMSALIGQPELGYDVVGFVDDLAPRASWAIATQHAVVRPRALGELDRLPALLEEHAIDEVIVALHPTANERLHGVIEHCRAARVPFMLLPDLCELGLERFQIHQLDGLPLLSVTDQSLRGWNRTLKRMFDLMFAGAMLLLGALPLAVIALFIRLDSPGPIFYRHRRVGRNGVPFTCHKFRTMRVGADREREQLALDPAYTGDRIMFKRKDDPRCTRVGRWLRRTSLDEFPNFLNVLRGEMSVVGPRPHLPDEVAQYESWQRRRLEVTPGITCLWQVNGRSHLTFAEQTHLDLYYAEHWSLWLDITIILRTIPAVLTGRGAY